MMILMNQNANDHLVSNIKFEVLDNFKYFGVNVNNKNNMQHKRVMSWNKCYYSVQLKSKNTLIGIFLQNCS